MHAAQAAPWPWTGSAVGCAWAQDLGYLYFTTAEIDAQGSAPEAVVDPAHFLSQCHDLVQVQVAGAARRLPAAAALGGSPQRDMRRACKVLQAWTGLLLPAEQPWPRPAPMQGRPCTATGLRRQEASSAALSLPAPPAHSSRAHLKQSQVARPYALIRPSWRACSSHTNAPCRRCSSSVSPTSPSCASAALCRYSTSTCGKPLLSTASRACTALLVSDKGCGCSALLGALQGMARLHATWVQPCARIASCAAPQLRRTVLRRILARLRLSEASRQAGWMQWPSRARSPASIARDCTSASASALSR